MIKKAFTAILFRNIKGALHLARGIGNSYDTSLEQLHSDTLKSAIFTCAIQLYPELCEEKEGLAFLDSFKISSAYPFYQSSLRPKPYYFLPKPDISKLPLEISNVSSTKQIKNIKYLEKSLFSQVINGMSNLNIEEDNLFDGFIVPNEEGRTLKAVLQVDNCTRIISNKPYQHVYINPDYDDEKKSEPYYVDKMFFHENAGLYFILDANNDLIKNKVINAVKLLADNGIGMDRNTGNGQFTFEVDNCIDSIELDIPNNANYEINLSLYCPFKEEIETTLNKSFFSTIKRGGYISSPQDYQNLTIRKRSIYMFKEGSVFPKIENRVGKIVNLMPDKNWLSGNELNHPIWRDGKAIFIPMVYSEIKA